MRELKFKLKDPTLTSDVNQTLSNLLSQVNKTNKNVTNVSNRVDNNTKIINQINQGGGGGSTCCDMGSIIDLPGQTITTSGSNIYVVDNTIGFIADKSGAVEFQGTMSLDYSGGVPHDINAGGHLRFGLGSSTPWDGSNGNQYIGFLLVKNSGSLLGNWQCIMYDGVNAAQQIDSGVLAVDTISAVFSISINAAGTEIVFSIGGNVVATMTTHIPTILLYLEILVEPSAGNLIATTGGLEAASMGQVIVVQLDEEVTRAKAAEAALKIDLQTNGADNGSQSKLNLAAGTNVTITDGGTGTVTIAASGGGGGSGAIVLLETVNASSSATIDLTSLSSTYDEYLIEVVCLVGSANGFALMAQLSTNGGSSYDSTTTNYIGGSHYDRMDAGGAGDNSGETGFPGAYLTDSYNSGQPGVSASIKFFNDASGSNYRQFIYQTNGPGNGGGYYTQTGGAIWKSTAQANAIRILLNTGNMTSGSVRLYGITH